MHVSDINATMVCGSAINFERISVPPPPDVTLILQDAVAEKAGSADELFQRVYDELKALAGEYLRRESRGHTLQATALVNEAYLKMVKHDRVDWKSKTHFFAVSAQAMQRILIDHAREKKRVKRGGKWRRTALDDAVLYETSTEIDLSSLHESLAILRDLDERQCKIVELRLFGNLSSKEISHFLECSQRTVEREWMMGRAWLRRELNKGNKCET